MLGHSLNTRLLTSVSLLLLLFFSLTSGVLDYFFRDLSLQAISDRLEVQAQALMAAADEITPGKLVPATEQLDARFLAPNSGLYGEIVHLGSKESWRSPSLLDAQLTINSKVRPGEKRFAAHVMPNGTRVLVLSVGYSWEFSNHAEQRLVFSVAESEEPYFKQLSRFRWRLFGGFGVMSLLLVTALGMLLRRELKPLRQIEREIAAIEAGQLQQLSTGLPRELAGVTANMNALLRNERERMTRYRNTLGNLTHSLKTPLAVMRTMLATTELQPRAAAQQLDEQVSRMDNIVRYQLKRAAAAAGTTLGAAPVVLREVIGPLRDALQKVYVDRGIHCELDIADDCRFVCDQGDLLEISGNLLDNAFKYGQRNIKFTAKSFSVANTRHSGITIVVEDDGPGIAVDKRAQALERGARLDERQSGQGIGLSVVSELAVLYRGSVEIDQSTLGGARVTVHLLGV